jgi:hypothetical protein
MKRGDRVILETRSGITYSGEILYFELTSSGEEIAHIQDNYGQIQHWHTWAIITLEQKRLI